MGQDHHKDPIRSAPVGYASHKIVLDDRGNPCDYLFLDVNPTFEKLTGLKSDHILNRRITEVLPGITEDKFDWIGTYGDIALHHGEKEFDQYSEPLKRWYRVKAYSPEKMYFVTVFVDITEMKRAVQEQSILLDNIQTQIWYLRDVEHYGRVNQAHADFMGKSPEELEYHSLFHFLREAEANVCLEVNKKIFSERKTVTTKEWVANGKGEKRLLNITKNPKLDSKGNVEFIVCSAEDVTERRREKNRLRQSEEKFRHIFEYSPLGILYLYTDGEIAYCNDNFVRIIGSSHEALTGLNILNLPDKKLLKAVMGALDGTITSYEGDYRSVTADKVTPVRVLFAPTISEAGEVMGVIGMVEDITDRKKTEKALKQSENKYRQLFENSPVSIWEQDFSGVKARLDSIFVQPVDDVGDYFRNHPELVREMAGLVKVLDVNVATLRIYEADSKEKLFEGIHTIFSEESYEDFIPVLELIANKGKELSLQKQHVTLKGEPKFVHLHWTVAPGYEKDYSRVLISIMDITDQKKTESLVRKNLEEKNVLLSEIHHRVKNNMAVITSLLGLQSDFDGQKSTKKTLQDTQNRVHSMALVHELVYETRNFAEISVGTLLQRLSDNLEKVYRSDTKDISVSISSDDTLLDLNQSVPCTLLANELITNAYRHAFTHTDQGTIDVIFKEDENGYSLTVRDDGKGLDDPDMIYQPDSFGYTIIHGLVKQLGGILTLNFDKGLSVEVCFKPQKHVAGIS